MDIKLLLKGTALEPISKDHTTFLKGIAILLIVFHNYYKWVFPITGENEFWFSADFLSKSLVYLRSDPLQFFNLFFNLLGFYGVQVFMVISAYGLTRSWNREPSGYGRFLVRRFDKLYPSFFMAGVLFIIIYIIREARVPGPSLQKDLLYQLLLVPCRGTDISGPWWFYSFIFQFYLVFPVMMLVNRKAGFPGLLGMVLTGYIVTIGFYAPLKEAGYNPYYTFIGHMPEFCLGIWMASRERIRVPYLVQAVALAVLILGQIYETVWPFANLAASLLLMLLIQWLWAKRESMRPVVKVVSFVGVVSMYLFASHGLIRNGFFNLANYLASPWAALLLGIAFVIFGTGLSWLLMHTEGSFRAWVRRPERTWARYVRFFAVILLIIGTALYLFYLSNRATAVQQKDPAVIASLTDSFENLDPVRQKMAGKEIVHTGAQSQMMPPPEYYSLSLDADLTRENTIGLVEAVASVWLYSNDSLAQPQLVFEVIDRSTGKMMEWRSQVMKQDKLPLGTWTYCEYRYPVPPEYRRPGYRFRTFVWNNSKGGFYADDLRLELRARR